MTKEALKLALEALETPWNAPYVDGCDLALGKKVKALTAIKEALANEALEKMAENARELGLDYGPEQEPVAWVCHGTHGHHDIDFFEEDVDSLSVGTQLYTTPPPVAEPHKRTWVGLTDEDIGMCLDAGDGSMSKIISFIEAKLKAKNSL